MLHDNGARLVSALNCARYCAVITNVQKFWVPLVSWLALERASHFMLASDENMLWKIRSYITRSQSEAQNYAQPSAAGSRNASSPPAFAVVRRNEDRLALKTSDAIASNRQERDTSGPENRCCCNTWLLVRNLLHYMESPGLLRRVDECVYGARARNGQWWWPEARGGRVSWN